MKAKVAPKKKTVLTRADAQLAPDSPGTLTELSDLIVSAPQQVAEMVNAASTTLCWQVGTRSHREILKETLAAYGVEILQTPSAKLTEEFGRACLARGNAEHLALKP